MRSEDRRDNEALYNKMTIQEMIVNFTEPLTTDPVQVIIISFYFHWLPFELYIWNEQAFPSVISNVSLL